MQGLEPTRDVPKIGGTLPHDHYIRVLYSIAISLKRIADAIERGDHLTTKEAGQ